MEVGFCHLCKLNKLLCNSHALLNSQFVPILRSGNGKGISLTNDEKTFNKYSSDSWHKPLFCRECERRLNDDYDRFACSTLTGKFKNFFRTEKGIVFEPLESERLRMSFLSILWRISISTHLSYSNVELPYTLQDELWSFFYFRRIATLDRYVVSISKITDSTETDGFEQEHLRNMVFSPFARRYEGFISVCFLFLGFFIEIFIPMIPPKYLTNPGVVHGSTGRLVVPFIEILDIPEVVEVLISGLKKDSDGKTKF